MPSHFRKLAPAAAVHRRLCAAITLLVAWPLSPAPRAAAFALTPSLPTLTSIGDIRLLDRREVSRAYPVHLKAVITYYDPFINAPRNPMIMATDATGTIYVRIPGQTSLPLTNGSLVDITGVSDPGEFGPIVTQAHLEIIGHAALPATAPRQSMTQLLTGSEDAQFIELEGVVRSVQFSHHNVTLTLALADGEIAATTLIEPDADYASLVDARIVIRGVAGSLFNRGGQLFGAQLLFPGLETLRVVQAAPPHPFQLPIQPISSLMQYSPSRTFTHRVHLRGTVLLFWPGRLLCLQNGAALCAETTQTTPLILGDTVDVIGFPQIGTFSPTLSGSLYLPLPPVASSSGGTSGPLSVEPVDAAEAFSGSHDARLVQIEGRLLAHDRASQDTTIVVSSGNFNFSVILPSSADPASTQALLALQEGSILKITGICSVLGDSRITTHHDGLPVPKYFQIMLRSSTDVTVLERPSWWNAVHTLRVLAVALCLTLLLLIWSVFLRVRLKQHAELLRFQATHDGLTGIWNRKAVLDLLRREFEQAARAHQRIGVMMLDVDHFKRVNDTYGHLAGDAVLKELARRIHDAVRSYDIIGRYGGEEFLIVLPGCWGDELALCAERVRAAIADDPIAAEGTILAVTVSVGTAVLDPFRNSEKDALAASDSALYDAKHSGRNRVVYCDLQPTPTFTHVG